MWLINHVGKAVHLFYSSNLRLVDRQAPCRGKLLDQVVWLHRVRDISFVRQRFFCVIQLTNCQVVGECCGGPHLRIVVTQRVRAGDYFSITGVTGNGLILTKVNVRRVLIFEDATLA